MSITGVSGSGKSSFIRGVLVPALARELPRQVDHEGFAWTGGSWNGVEGATNVSSVLALEPRTPTTQRRSTVATILGLADDLRRIFGRSPEAQALGLKPTDFGWNAGGGRCQTCLGLGEIDDDGGWVTCPHCGGTRFGEEVLSIRLDGQSVPDILGLSMAELLATPLASEAGWCPLLEQLVALDLGYLTLGRRLDRVSGGEHQRLRIAQTITREQSEGLLLVLDEPSAGLHPQDVARLLQVLDRVVAKGTNTVLLVEHNPDLIRASDWIVDFGPGGGPEGGRIVGQDPPDKIAKLDTPTGRVLAGTQETSSSFQAATTRPKSRSRAIVSETSVRNARQWLRRLVGEASTAEDLDPVDFDGLAVMFDAASEVARPHEIGGLDIEIGRLLLDRADDSSDEFARLAHTWAENPKCHLQIHPMMEEIRVWGSRIPVSVRRTVLNRLTHMGLDASVDALNEPNLGAIRTTGKRFQLAAETPRERLRCLRDAISIGGSYVELANDDGVVLGTIRWRHIDLESRSPAVAPLSTGSAGLSRAHAVGRCPCCDGSGSVPSVDQKLFIACRTANPLDEDLLTPEALGVLRGVRRNTLVPFFRRMIAEGLWSQDRSFSRLGPEERALLMHGYWSRPSHGSFLKSSRHKPEDVRSWLRWDGLTNAILAESGRSNNAPWRQQVETTTKPVKCPRCLGTGLQLHSRAFLLGKRSLFDWVRQGSIKEFIDALREMTPPSERGNRMKVRILYCLEPLCKAVPQSPLGEPINDPDLLRIVFERTVRSMTQLKVAN